MIETNEPLPKNIRSDMNSGDTIRFGRLTNTWRLENVPIVCCSSTLNENLVAELKKLLNIVNGQYINEFTENQTHLVMPSITMTIKGNMRNNNIMKSNIYNLFIIFSFAIDDLWKTNCYN